MTDYTKEIEELTQWIEQIWPLSIRQDPLEITLMGKEKFDHEVTLRRIQERVKKEFTQVIHSAQREERERIEKEIERCRVKHLPDCLVEVNGDCDCPRKE